MFMEKILISACLIGDKTKYDGSSNYNPLIEKLLEKYDLVPFCPEMEGGLKCPRNPSEIQKHHVVMSDGTDVTNNLLEGAKKAAMLCSLLGIRKAVLKESSPSCGSHEVYDGTFTHTKRKGMGFTASALAAKGIAIYSEDEIEKLL